MANIKLYLNKINKFREAHPNGQEYKGGRNGASIEEINQAYLKLKRVMRMQEDIADEIEVAGVNLRENGNSYKGKSQETLPQTENFIELDFTQTPNPQKKLKDEFDLLGLDVAQNTPVATQEHNTVAIEVNLGPENYADPGLIVYDSKITHTKKEDPEDFFDMIVSQPRPQKQQSESPVFNGNNLFL
jgi:hypothetical protein